MNLVRRSIPKTTPPAGSPSLFPLKDVPTAAEILALADRYPDLDAEAAAVVLKFLHTASEMVTTAETRFARAGISKGKFAILMLLLRSNRALPPSDLASRLGVTRATITGLVDGLERDGLVRREADRDDRRRVGIRLTAKAQRLLDGFLPGHFRRMRRLMSGFNKTERRDLLRLLDKLLQAVPKADEVE